MCNSPLRLVKRTGTGRQALSFWVMNRFRPKPAMSHITIAVALIGAAVTIGLAMWHSQKGKTQVPAIIDNQRLQHLNGKSRAQQMKLLIALSTAP